MAQSEEGESQCVASGRTLWVGAGREQKGTSLPHGQLCCLSSFSPHTVEDTGSFSAVDSLHLAGATVLLRRALTSSEPAAEAVDLVLALGFNSCQKEQAETRNFQSSDESFSVCCSLLLYWLSISTYVLLRAAYVRIWWLLLFLLH